MLQTTFSPDHYDNKTAPFSTSQKESIHHRQEYLLRYILYTVIRYVTRYLLGSNVLNDQFCITVYYFVRILLIIEKRNPSMRFV